MPCEAEPGLKRRAPPAPAAALKAFLEAHSRIAVLTGAGCSTASGIPDYRDEQGAWRHPRPMTLAEFRASPAARRRYWARSFVGWRRIEAAAPNATHAAIAALEAHGRVTGVITQNVDNLHRRAGSRNVVELHGNIMRSYCIRCKKEATEGEMAPIADGMPAVCSECGGLIRPDVVWFGEFLPEGAMAKATDAAYRSDVFLSIGTSAIVYPAAGIPGIAAGAGAYLVEINVQPSAIADSCDEVILGKAGEVLPQLVEAVRALRAG